MPATLADAAARAQRRYARRVIAAVTLYAVIMPAYDSAADFLCQRHAIARHDVTPCRRCATPFTGRRRG